MPLASRKQRKPDPEALYVAWDAASVGDYVVKRGAKLRGDHPAVQQVPWLFLPADTPDDEIDQHRRQEYQKELAKGRASARQTSEYEPQIPKPAPPLRDEDAVIAIRLAGVVASERIHDQSGQLRTVDAGEKLPRDHPIVKRDPKAFVEITNGIPHDRARVASQQVSSQDEDGNVRLIHAGQWADKDDPLVQINRHAFTRPEDHDE